MKFDVYERFQVEILREGERWVAYTVALGKRSKLNVVIPEFLDAADIAVHLDDLFHESAAPGQTVRKID